jgi:hypothetical protein
MSRAAFYHALVNDLELVHTWGIKRGTVFHNYSSEERPCNTGPFIILRWTGQDRPRWQKVKAPDLVTVWVHWPIELSNDYFKLVRILDRIDEVVADLRDVPGSDGYILSFVQIGGRSGDFVDDGFGTITKNGVYEVFSRKPLVPSHPMIPNPGEGVNV